MPYIRILLTVALLGLLAACSTQPSKPVSTQEQQDYARILEVLDAGREDEARVMLLAFINEHPQRAGAYANLARLYQQQGETDKATRRFEQALALRPDSPAIYNAIGIHYRKLGRFTDAEAAYLAGLKRDSGAPLLLRNLGILYDLYLRQPAQALIYYRRYQAALAEKDPQVALWIVDLQRRQTP